MRNVVSPRNLASLQATGWNISHDVPRFVIAYSSAKYICFEEKGSIFPGYTPWQPFTSYCSPTLAVSINASKEHLHSSCIPGKARSAGYSVLLEGSVHFTQCKHRLCLKLHLLESKHLHVVRRAGFCVTWQQHCQASETWALHHPQQRFQHHNPSQKR